MKRFPLVLLLLPALLLGVEGRQRAATTDEISQAEHDVPRLAQELGLQPGMTVADIGAGFGAVTLAMAKFVGPEGRVYATDVGSAQLAALRAAVERDKLQNVRVLEGAQNSTNVPDGCCDALFMRDVYHHLTDPEAFNRSLLAALKPGGRFAVIDFLPRPGSGVPEGVSADRGGHGVPVGIVIRELTEAGFSHMKTLDKWPPDRERQDFFLALFRKP